MLCCYSSNQYSLIALVGVCVCVIACFHNQTCQPASWMILCSISWLSINVLHRPDFIDLSVASVITWRWRYCYWGLVCVWMSMCMRVYVCVRVLLMSSAAVNDSIRLFLNALVTPMGHSARESAHSAERAQTLAGHQRHAQTHTHTHT